MLLKPGRRGPIAPSMKPLRACLLLLVALVLAAPATASASGRLLVLEGDAGTLVPKGKDRYDLEIRGVDQDVTWFADRPVRRAGSLSLREVVRDWKKFGFVADPPNAAIELTAGAPKADVLTVELGRPRLRADRDVLRVSVRRIAVKDGALAGHAEGVDRTLPRRFGRVSVFVDGAAWFARSVTVSVLNASGQDLAVNYGLLTGGTWDNLPIPGSVISAAGQTTWVNGAANAFMPLGGTVLVSPASGGTISLSWNWGPGTPVSGSVTSQSTIGLAVTSQLVNTQTSSPTMQVIVTNAPFG